MAYPILRQTILRLAQHRTRVFEPGRLPQTGGFLIVANHQSFLDPLLIALPLIVRLNRRVFFLTKEPIWRAFQKLIGLAGVHWLGMVRVFDNNKADSLKEVKELLQRGEIVCIFPEGTRNRERPGELLPGKTGAARAALATGLPVVPIGVIAPAGRTTGEAIRNFFIPQDPAEIHVGVPMTLAAVHEQAFTYDLLVQTTRKFMQLISALSGRKYPY